MFYLGLVSYALWFFTALHNRVVSFKEPRLNKSLEGHLLSSKKVPNEGSCRVNCYLNPDCVAINIRAFDRRKADVRVEQGHQWKWTYFCIAK